jgi:predicted SnoaL-like aldol condensation-catalyzing enzyme
MYDIPPPGITVLDWTIPAHRPRVWWQQEDEQMSQTSLGITAMTATVTRPVEIAVDFLTLAAAGKAQSAWERYGTPDFRHHNPGFAGDGETLVAAMDEDAAEHPDRRLDIQRVIAEGPLVAIHSALRRGDQPDVATVHIFRIEDGRIREFWDIAQEIPAESPNQHGMF